ncbi:MAG: pantetheine-phosphate adenylyltransferase [Actinomycetes bacterium]
MATVLYPGSCDPVHLGHRDVVEPALELFGEVIVTAMHNPSKPSGWFSLDERLAILDEAVAPRRGEGRTVRVASFGGLAVDAARSLGADFIVKGLRTGGDFEVEQQMAQTNYVAAAVRTVYLPCNPALVYLSSRFIREIAQYGGDVSAMVPPSVLPHLQRATREA